MTDFAKSFSLKYPQ